MEYIAENWDTILMYAAAGITAASVIAKVTPSKTDDKYVALFGKFIQFLSLNTTPTGPKTKKDDENA